MSTYVSSMITALTTGDCDVTAFTGTSAQGQSMVAGQTYRFTASAACWLKFGANPTAVAGADGNIYLPANIELLVMCQGTAVKAAVIQDTVGGNLSQVLVIGA